MSSGFQNNAELVFGSSFPAAANALDRAGGFGLIRNDELRSDAHAQTPSVGLRPVALLEASCVRPGGQRHLW